MTFDLYDPYSTFQEETGAKVHNWTQRRLIGDEFNITELLPEIFH